ncbi:MAG: TIGR02206 family membrane protein [Anaerolineae bacterium]|nr:TIGR02206 family membrane protein [Anaerolineae bacterium]
MSIFAKDWTGNPFVLFGRAHLVGLVIVVLTAALFIILGRRTSETGKKNLRYLLAGVLLVTEMSWHLWNYFTGQWTIQTMLPLHLCSALVWLSIYMLLRKSERIYEFAYLLGIAGALQALLTPDAGRYGWPHLRFSQVLISHGAIITAALYMTLVEDFRPTGASVKRVILGSNLYMLAVFIINFILGSNYMFIARKPDTASLLDVLPLWPWYIAIIELLGLGFVVLFYSPFAIQDWRRQVDKPE